MSSTKYEFVTYTFRSRFDTYGQDKTCMCQHIAGIPCMLSTSRVSCRRAGTGWWRMGEGIPRRMICGEVKEGGGILETEGHLTIVVL
jgi:hypothetical protein